ncbi:PREDICTED: growth-regulating factor 6 [Tarenaya hassleriana]|uniref:growth-regulating factor 6 n=1 Tax=Tarenaya hassleriana TaxID=28532 RepID=UPI00053C8A83|nr:PREDICTED: growth-regulating factor 6 [Tarenaya hassleriana]
MATTRVPFTESQWEELEHQAVIFKYIVAGVPVPPDLLFPIRRTLISSSSSSLHLSSKFFSHASTPHFSWNVYDMGFGRKMDPEPGRCRRTDGKKWRCSKEAYPDSKYCERHMHRGKNRSRKPVEFSITSSSSSSVSATSSTFSFNNLKDTANLPSLCLNTAPLSRPANDDPRGRRRGVYMDDFFSTEPSGSIRSFSGSSMVDGSRGFTPLAASSYFQKHRNNNYYSVGGAAKDEKPNHHCFILGTDIAARETPLMLGKKMKQGEDHEVEEEEEEEQQRNKRVHRFLDEWPSSNTSSVSTSLII